MYAALQFLIFIPAVASIWLVINSIGALLESSAPQKMKLAQRFGVNFVFFAAFLAAILTGLLARSYESFGLVALPIGILPILFQFFLDRNARTRAIREIYWVQIDRARKARSSVQQNGSNIQPVDFERISSRTRYARSIAFGFVAYCIFSIIALLIGTEYNDFRSDEAIILSVAWFLSPIITTWIKTGPRRVTISEDTVKIIGRAGKEYSFRIQDILFIQVYRFGFDICIEKTEKLEVLEFSGGGIKAADWNSLVRSLQGSGLVV